MSGKTMLLKIQRGFTLIELLITMTVLGVLMGIALPNLQSFILSNRLSSDVNGFIGFINYARSEAIARNQSVVICPRNNAAITCQASEFWGQFEVQAFIDINGDNERDAADILLKTVPATDTTATERRLTRVGGAGVIRFSAVGMSQTPHRFDTFAIRAGDPEFEARYGRSICISRPGRARVTPLAAGVAACDDF